MKLSNIVLPITIFLSIAAAIALLFSMKPEMTKKVDAKAVDMPASIKHLPIVSPNLRLVKHDPERAYPGLSLIASDKSKSIFLINMEGKIVRWWPLKTYRARLLNNCNLLVGLKELPVDIEETSNWDNGDWKSVKGKKFKKKFKKQKKLDDNQYRERLIEYDWNGKHLWSYSGKEQVHHDMHRLKNGNTYLLERVQVPAEKIPSDYKLKSLLGKDILEDLIREVTPDGKVVFEWRYSDYFRPDYCGRELCNELAKKLTYRSGNAVDWTHTNTIIPVPENHWYREGHKEFRPGNLFIQPRNWSMAYIIDRETKEIVWEYAGDYRGGLEGAHQVHMIEEGLPGAGNVLMIDNGDVGLNLSRHTGESFVLEINPVTKEIVWVYDVGNKFHTPSRGSAQRLPNGNTLISEDKHGHVFEVTPDKEIVWEVKLDDKIARTLRYEFDHCPELGKYRS